MSVFLIIAAHSTKNLCNSRGFYLFTFLCQAGGLLVEWTRFDMPVVTHPPNPAYTL